MKSDSRKTKFDLQEVQSPVNQPILSQKSISSQRSQKSQEKIKPPQFEDKSEKELQELHQRKTILENKILDKQQEIQEQIKRDSVVTPIYSKYDPNIHGVEQQPQQNAKNIDSYRFSENPKSSYRDYSFQGGNESSQSGYDYQIVSQLYQKIEKTEQSYNALKEMLEKTLNENKELQLKLANTDTNPEYPIHSNDNNVQLQTEINALRLNLNEKINDNLKLEQRLDKLLDQKTSNAQIEDILKIQLQEKKKQQIEQEMKIQNMDKFNSEIMQELSKKLLTENGQTLDAKDLEKMMQIDGPEKTKVKEKSQSLKNMKEDIIRLEKHYVLMSKQIKIKDFRIKELELNEKNLMEENDFIRKNLAGKIVELNDVRQKLTQLHIETCYQPVDFSKEDQVQIDKIQKQQLHQRKNLHNKIAQFESQGDFDKEEEDIVSKQQLFRHNGQYMKNALKFELDQKEEVISVLRLEFEQVKREQEGLFQKIGMQQAELARLRKGTQPAKSKQQLDQIIKDLQGKNATMLIQNQSLKQNNKICLEMLANSENIRSQQELRLQEIQISNKSYLTQQEKESNFDQLEQKLAADFELERTKFQRDFEIQLKKYEKLNDELKLYKQTSTAIIVDEPAQTHSNNSNQLEYLIQNIQIENQQLKLNLNQANQKIKDLEGVINSQQNQKFEFQQNLDEFMAQNEKKLNQQKEDIKQYLAKIYELEIQVQTYEKDIQDFRLKEKTPNQGIQNLASWTLKQYRD